MRAERLEARSVSYSGFPQIGFQVEPAAFRDVKIVAAVLDHIADRLSWDHDAVGLQFSPVGACHILYHLSQVGTAVSRLIELRILAPPAETETPAAMQDDSADNEGRQ